MSLGGNRRASRVEEDALKYSSHLILKPGDTFAVAMSWSFSNVNSGEMEFSA